MWGETLDQRSDRPNQSDMYGHASMETGLAGQLLLRPCMYAPYARLPCVLALGVVIVVHMCSGAAGGWMDGGFWELTYIVLGLGITTKPEAVLIVGSSHSTCAP